ncbi:hypothetical protein [Rhodopseudomonas boonkerdii]|nr:hypothetical protein [Rhodopseudomonas boonkerdii]
MPPEHPQACDPQELSMDGFGASFAKSIGGGWQQLSLEQQLDIGLPFETP